MNTNKTTCLDSLGKRLYERRKQLGWTQEQAAEKTGLSVHFFATTEQGKTNMRAENILKVCREMRMSADYLLTGIPTNIDREFVVESLNSLSAEQLHYAEEIIKNYVLGCGTKEIDE